MGTKRNVGAAPRMPVWTSEMEKRLGRGLHIVLSDPRMARLWQRFGAEAFRRSSVFHGLDEFLSEQAVAGRVCFEIGTWNGLTAVVLSQYFERVISVDIIHNALKHDVIDHLGIKNIRCFDIADNADKARIAREFPFDFCYMDGNHAHDTDQDWELVKPCGRVLFHEFWPFQKPVWDLVNALPADQVAINGEGLALWTRPEPA